MIRGVFTLVKYKAVLDENGEWVPGEVVSVQEENNTIQYRYFSRHMINGSLSGFSLHFGSEASTRRPVAHVSAIPTSNILNATYNFTQWVRGGHQSTPTLTPGTLYDDPVTTGFYTTHTRFSVPVSTRYIRSVLLGSENNTTTWRTTSPFSCVTLTAPCIQEPDEILDVFYRVFVDIGATVDGTIDTTRRIAYDFGVDSFIWFTESGFTALTPDNYYIYYPRVITLEQTKVDSVGIYNIPALWRSSTVRQGDWSSNIDCIFGHRFSVGIPATSANVAEYHGLLVRGFGVKGNVNNFITRQPASKGVSSSVQNTFRRSADSGNFRRAHLDIENLATSAATVTVSDPNTWAAAVNREPFAHQYRIEITTGGVTGTAQYRVRRRRCTGWNFSMYHPMPIPMPTMQSPAFQTFNDLGLPQPRYGQIKRRVQQYAWPEFLTHDVDGITVMHVNGEWENIDANSTVPLTATGIAQIGPAYSGGEMNGDMFVACNNTGLWKIVRPSQGPVTSITQVTPAGITNPNSCRGVTVNRTNGDVWALFHDITDSILYLAKSTDQGVTWTLYDETTDPQFLITDYTSGTPGPTGVFGMHINPYSANDQFFFVTPDAPDVQTNNNHGHWWSAAGSSPTSNQVRFNATLNSAGYVKWRDYMHNSAQPLDATTWFFAGPHSADSSLYPRQGSTNYFGNCIATFGGAAASATNVTASTASFPNNTLGVLGALTYHDETSSESYMIGVTTGANMNPGISSGMTQTLVARTASQYNTNSGTILYANSTSTILTFNNNARSAVLQGMNQYFNSVLTHIGKGIFLGCNDQHLQPYFFTTLYGDGRVAIEHDIPWFEDYGWDGAAWVRNEPASKLTHAGDELLLDTLQIQFNDEAGTAPFVVGEYYDVFVYDGILLDDATAFSQTVYNYMQATGTGTDFTPGTVPAADLGARVAEPISQAFCGGSDSEVNLSTPVTWGEPGIIIAGKSPGAVLSPLASASRCSYMEQRLTGDFEVRFKLTQDGTEQIPRISLVDWSAIEAAPKDLKWNGAAHRFHIRYQRVGVNNANEDLAYNLRVHTGAFDNNTVAANLDTTTGAESDIFAFRRTGTTVELLVNNSVIYTFPTATGQDLGIATWHNNLEGVIDEYTGGWTLYDGEVDYTVARRYAEVGNGTTTGAQDINFARIIHYQVRYIDLNILLDGVPAVILADAVTAPGPGEVQILPCSGRLWFNAADAGKTITGNWRILKKLNLE